MVLFHSVVNVAILGLILLFAFQYQLVRNREVSDARYTLAHYLFGCDDPTQISLYREIETIEEFVSVLERTVQSYYAIPARTRELFMHYTDPNTSRAGVRDAIAPPQLFLQYHEGYYRSSTYSGIATETYPLTLDSPLGPFAKARGLLRNSSESCAPQVDHVAGGAFIPCRVSAVGDFLDRVVRIQLSFSLFSRERWWFAGGVAAIIPSTWDILVEYGFEGHKAVMTMAVRLSSVSRRQLERGPLLVCWLIGFATLIDLYWRLWTQLKEAKARRKLKQRHHRQQSSGASVPASASATTPLPMLDTPYVRENGWRTLGYLSNAVTLAFTVTALVAQNKRYTNDTLEEAVTLLLAFAAMLSSFRVVVLLKLFPAWYVLIDGLATALQQLSVLAVGVLPVLVGYAVCGTAAFGGFSGSSYFQSVPQAVVTLLCSMFGDNLFDTFLGMDQSPHQLQIFFARLFMITFMMVFVCNILNIAHSIIQDSYSQALKSYASLVAAKQTRGGESVPVPLPSPQSKSEDRSGAFTEDRREATHLKQRSAKDTDKAFTPSGTYAAPSSPSQGAFRQRFARLRTHGPLRAAEVEHMLARLEQLSPD